MRHWLAGIRDRAGVANIEAALLTSLVLAPVLGGATDAGLILYYWGEITRAEQAGILSAWGNSAITTGTIVNAAQTAFGNSSVTPTIQAAITCYCLPSASPWNRTGAVAVACPSTCASGSILTEYATVSVSTLVTLPLPVSPLGLSSPYPIVAKATARVQ